MQVKNGGKEIMGVIASVAMVCCLALAVHAGPNVKMKPIFTVPHEFDMLVKAGHIQGLACSTNGIYLSHALGLAKIGWDGRLVKHVDAPAHLGGIACANGRIYGSFIIRAKANMKDGKPGLLRVWDENLNIVAEKPFAETSGSVGVLGDTLYYAIGAEKNPHRGCRVKMLGLDLSEKGDVALDLGYDIRYGVQAVAAYGDKVLLVCYGGTSLLDAKLRNPVRLKCPSFAEGIALVPKSISGMDEPVFMAVRAMGGNMKAWRKDPVNNPPRIRLDFYSFNGSSFIPLSGAKKQ